MFSLFFAFYRWILRLFHSVPDDGGDFGRGDGGGDDDGGGPIICYYGCPNSKKAQKLQLKQKLFR